MKNRGQILNCTVITLEVSILLSLCILPAPVASEAGECPYHIEYYIEEIEKLSKLDPPYKNPEGFYCLSCLPEDSRLWAGPIAAKRFDDCRKSRFRERIAAACRPFLDDTTSTNKNLYYNIRLGAAALLAFYGYGEVGGHDIFGIITSDWDRFIYVPFHLLTALAAQRDQRTVPFLSSVYDSLNNDDEDRYKDYVVVILNCIYHIPGNPAVELAKKIHERETNEYIRERAYRVLKR